MLQRVLYVDRIAIVFANNESHSQTLAAAAATLDACFPILVLSPSYLTDSSAICSCHSLTQTLSVIGNSKTICSIINVSNKINIYKNIPMPNDTLLGAFACLTLPQLPSHV